MKNLNRNISQEKISSIFQGKFYKDNEEFFKKPAISLAWNLDGSGPIRWGKSTMWPFQLLINDLPIEAK